MKTVKNVITGLCLTLCTICSIAVYASDPMELNLQAVSYTQNEESIEYHILAENSDTLLLHFNCNIPTGITHTTINDHCVDVELGVEDPFVKGNSIKVTDQEGIETIYLLPAVIEDNTDDKPTLIADTGLLEVSDISL